LLTATLKLKIRNKIMTRSEAGKLGAIKSAQIQKHQKELRIQEYNKNPSKCRYCGKTFPYEKRTNKFCNQSCAASFNNKLRPKEENFCLNCEKKISIKRKFCNNKCQGEYRIKQSINEIEKAGVFPHNENTNETTRSRVRKYLITKYGHKCSICGLSEWMGQPIPLVADHIDGNTTNHKVENFRMVCENCNAQLPTYKSKNKHGRVWRKKYYKNCYAPSFPKPVPSVRIG
jgi:hypothetical protein